PPRPRRSFRRRPRSVAHADVSPAGPSAFPAASRGRGNQMSGPRTRGRRCSCPSSLLRNIFFFSSLLTATRDTKADEPPKITLERIVDGRGNRVCDVAKASVKSENERQSAWLVRGLLRGD